MTDSPPPSYDHFGENHLVSRLNRRFSNLLQRTFRLPADWHDNPGECFRTLLSRVNNLALFLLFLGGIISGIVLMIAGIQEDSSALFFFGIAVIPAVFVVQFILSLFCSANLDLTFGRPIELVSRLVPEALVVLGFLQFLYVIIIGGFLAFQSFSASLQSGFGAVLAFVSLLILGWVQPWMARNFETVLNIKITKAESQGPADYLFSIILFLGRYQLALVPFYFVLATLVGAAVAVYSGILLVLGKESLGESLVMGALSASSFSSLSGSLTGFLFLILIPIAAHFLYLIVMSLADIGAALFRLVRSSERIAQLSDEAMKAPRDDES